MRNSQHGFVKNKLCQTKVICFIDRITGPVGKKEAADMTTQVDHKRTVDTVPDDTEVPKGNTE